MKDAKKKNGGEGRKSQKKSDKKKVFFVRKSLTKSQVVRAEKGPSVTCWCACLS